MLRQRVITALLLGLPILGILLFAPPPGIVIVLAVMLLLGAWEWSGFLRTPNRGVRIVYVLLIAMLMALFYFNQFAVDVNNLLLPAIAWWLFAAAWVVLFPDKDSYALIYASGVLVLLPMWVALTSLVQHQLLGAQLILFLLMLIASTDIGAYFTGRAFGRHKLAPRVSPGKTWEGVVGGLLSSIIIAVFAAHWFDFQMTAFVVLSLITAMFSIIGDLTESLFKRHSGLKDSGNILPGHGGVLDRIDSITAASPVFVYGLIHLNMVRL